MRKALAALAFVAVIATLTVVLRPSGVTLPPADAKVPLSVRVAGNQLVDQTGAKVQLRGVNHSGAQYACAEGTGLFDAPATDATIAAMKAWGVTAVRVPLNETCWLGSTQIRPGMRGSTYRHAIAAWVNKLTTAGLPVIVDAHWTQVDTKKATNQRIMPTRAFAPLYWRSVAATFKNNPAVMFDLFNEPYPDDNQDTTAAWKCVRDGGACGGTGFVTAGMQELVLAVRSSGAKNVILVPGPEYAGSLTRWLEFKPVDPANQLVASVHIYGQPLGSPYDDPKRWPEIDKVAAKVPVVIGEMGDSDCSHKFSDKLTKWADTRGISYLAWGWVVSDCADEPSLLKDYKGTPSGFGVGIKAGLQKKR
ncbi:glycoside hydrolase family 5 protein [Streptomyces sp. SID13031]|uniref:cellulase family glycosylhydrolase n=1 Tax=Streptomyces sp. SID13031 TaxID=2706046 RepID=UPI0013C74A4B|nr:glycoside hydrolase family 5 protein [Streptomyces sp. SID13031]